MPGKRKPDAKSEPSAKKRKLGENQVSEGSAFSLSYKGKKEVPDTEEDPEKAALSAQILLEEIDGLDRQEKNPLLKNLNRLAWLLNHNTKSCTAISLIKNKLLITDNDISSDTRRNNFKFIHIGRILDALRNIVDVFKKTKQLNRDLLAELFKIIFDEKFEGEEIGYLSSITAYRYQIRDGLIDFIKNGYYSIATKREEMKKLMLEKMAPIMVKIGYSEQKVATAVGLGISIICRLQEIIPFIARETDGAPTIKNALDSLTSSLENSDEGNSEDLGEEDLDEVDLEETREEESKTGEGKAEPIIEEQQNAEAKIKVIRYILARENPNKIPGKEDREWLHSNDYGCAVLAVNRKGTHAELRSVDCLLASGIITPSYDDDVYIGISRKCCIDCFIAIQAVNRTLSNKNIHVSGSHYRSFENWDKSKPFFLLRSQPERESKTKARSNLSMQAKRMSGKIEAESSEFEDSGERDKVLIGQILVNFNQIKKEIESGRFKFSSPQEYMSQEDTSSHPTYSHESHSGSISEDMPSPIDPVSPSDISAEHPSTIVPDPSDSHLHPSLFSSKLPFFQSVSSQQNENPFSSAKNSLTALLRHLRDQRDLGNQANITEHQETIQDILSLIEDIRQEIEDSGKNTPSTS